MGVLNVTPDSFSDGGELEGAEAAIARGLRLFEEGADWVDVGGESTRPGSDAVPPEEQIRRVVSVIQTLAEKGVPISIDARLAAVARAGLDAGATLVNDISALSDPAMAPLVASRGAFLIQMHMLGMPKTMQKSPAYSDVLGEVRAFLAERLEFAERQGIPKGRMAADPGIGFGKNLQHNLALLGRLDEFASLGVPIAVGLSRKSFLGALTGRDAPHDRLAASLSAAVSAFRRGARIFRVHDVAATRDALRVAEALREHEPGNSVGPAGQGSRGPQG
jgi:dihydropteroate synthase